jgi:serine/threonine-protein kinase
VAATLETPQLARLAQFEPITLASRPSAAPAVRTDVVDPAATSSAERYERVDMLGSGGMGEVWLHRDRRIGRRVAIKTLKGEGQNDVARDRFLREVRVQGQLEHPSIVPVYDLDVDPEGRTFFTMKRVRGETLERIIERLAAQDPSYLKKFSARRLLQAFAQVCLTMDYAHARGVLHAI